MPNIWDVGSLVRVSATFRDINQVLTDPTTVVLRYKPAYGAVVVWTYLGAGSIVRDSVGQFHADLDTTAIPGVWLYRWVGTGALQAAGDLNFLAFDSPIR